MEGPAQKKSCEMQPRDLRTYCKGIGAPNGCLWPESPPTLSGVILRRVKKSGNALGNTLAAGRDGCSAVSWIAIVRDTPKWRVEGAEKFAFASPTSTLTTLRRSVWSSVGPDRERWLWW
jgi:hypothetical protein